MTEHLHAAPHEQTDRRQGYRNGSYTRQLTTRVGTLDLEVPRDREGTFQTSLFDRYQRSEKALVLALMQMVVQGVSTRRVKKITTELCGREFTRSTVSRLCEGLDEQVDAWAQRGNGIHLWNAHHSTLRHNTVRRTRDGMYFSHSDHTDTARNVIKHVRYGLHFMYSDDNQFSDNVFVHNVSGSALMYSSRIDVHDNDFRSNRTKNGYGLLLQSVDQSTFRNNRLVGNMAGLYLENSSANTFERNIVRANFRGLRLTGSSMNNRFTRNVVHGNLQTVLLAGVSSTNVWSVDGVGNFWGTGGLLDIDQDGVSEMPRRVVDVLGDRQESFPYVGLLASSPGVEALTFALRRAPLPGVPTIVDPHPLMQADERRSTADPACFGLLLGALATFLIVIQRLKA